MTKDERFLLEMYRIVQKSPKQYVNPLTVAKKLGYKDLLVKDILKGLRQSNLIKIYSIEEVMLTERGKEVAHRLLS